MELNEKEQKKYEIIEKVVNNEISKKDAENQLSLSRKQINRFLDRSDQEELKMYFKCFASIKECVDIKSRKEK